MNRFNFYHQTIFSRDFLLKTNGGNIMIVPSFSKIVLNSSIKASHGANSTIVNQKLSSRDQSMGNKIAGFRGNQESNNLSVLIALELLCGQKLKKTRSKKFIAGFKLRKNELIACKVSLRKTRMFTFFEKLIMVILPKLRDFQGFKEFDSSSVSLPLGNKVAKLDKSGSISFGIQNLLLFPELENHYELFESIAGFQITIVPKISSGNKIRKHNQVGQQATLLPVYPKLSKFHEKEALLLLSGNQLPF